MCVCLYIYKIYIYLHTEIQNECHPSLVNFRVEILCFLFFSYNFLYCLKVFHSKYILKNRERGVLWWFIRIRIWCCPCCSLALELPHAVSVAKNKFKKEIWIFDNKKQNNDKYLSKYIFFIYVVQIQQFKAKNSCWVFKYMHI